MDFRQRASQEQFSIMLDYMEMYGDLSRPQPGPQGRLNSERQWSELTELLNSVGGSGVTMDKWKRVWSDWKTKTKKKASIININAQGTGGGPSKGKPLNPLEERILNIIGLQSITGHQEVEEAGFPVVTSPIVPSNTTPIIIAEIQGETCTPFAVPLIPEPSGMDISMPSTSQTTHAIQRGTEYIPCRQNHMMFSLCRRYKDEHEHGGTQIKGGYMLRYKRKYLWNSWSEEWVVLYDDSTMAWFKDASAKCMATQKHLVKESPEMLAIATWTGQVPRRPPLPPGARLSQLMALGSRRDPGRVVWMLAKSDAEMKEWMTAITKTLPPPPHIELVMSMPYLRTAFKRPTVRVRPTSSEMYTRSARHAFGALDGRGLVAVIKRQVPLAGQLDHELSWGQGWGWVTLPNGVWSGRLTWSQEGEDFTLHAMPIMHHTNVSQACSMLDGVTAYEASAYEQALAEYDDAATTSDDWDLGVDCGDFMM